MKKGVGKKCKMVWGKKVWGVGFLKNKTVWGSKKNGVGFFFKQCGGVKKTVLGFFPNGVGEQKKQCGVFKWYGEKMKDGVGKFWKRGGENRKNGVGKIEKRCGKNVKQQNVTANFTNLIQYVSIYRYITRYINIFYDTGFPRKTKQILNIFWWRYIIWFPEGYGRFGVREFFF